MHACCVCMRCVRVVRRPCCVAQLVCALAGHIALRRDGVCSETRVACSERCQQRTRPLKWKATRRVARLTATSLFYRRLRNTAVIYMCGLFVMDSLLKQIVLDPLPARTRAALITSFQSPGQPTTGNEGKQVFVSAFSMLYRTDVLSEVNGFSIRLLINCLIGNVCFHWSATSRYDVAS